MRGIGLKTWTRIVTRFSFASHARLRSGCYLGRSRGLRSPGVDCSPTARHKPRTTVAAGAAGRRPVAHASPKPKAGRRPSQLSARKLKISVSTLGADCLTGALSLFAKPDPLQLAECQIRKDSPNAPLRPRLTESVNCRSRPRMGTPLPSIILTVEACGHRLAPPCRQRAEGAMEWHFSSVRTQGPGWPVAAVPLCTTDLFSCLLMTEKTLTPAGRALLIGTHREENFL
jgi:hypothetical protein